MFDIGRVCIKIAGRDAGLKCVIVELVDEFHVIVDGETRRRKVNVKHIDPTSDVLDIGKGDHASVVSAFDKLGLKARSTKPKQSKPRARQVRAADRKKAAEASVKKSKPAQIKKSVDKPIDKDARKSDSSDVSEKVPSEKVPNQE